MRSCLVGDRSIGTFSNILYRPPRVARRGNTKQRLREIVLEAKLDSGARTSSLHAGNLQQFRRDGKDWAAFDVTDNEGRNVRIERPLVRIAQVKSALGTDEARPTVTLGICIGTVYRVTEVNLVDRSELTKPLLVGRRFLRGRFLVDMGRRHLLEPLCRRKTVP